MTRFRSFIKKFIKFIQRCFVWGIALYLLGFRISFNFNEELYWEFVSLLNTIPLQVQLVLAIVISYFLIIFINRVISVIKNNTWFQKILVWIKPRIYGCGRFSIIALLSIYVYYNWEKCIEMNFFNDFDGNNILFLCWLALIFLTTYDVESKVLKIHMRKTEEQIKDFDAATLNYDLALTEHNLKSNKGNIKEKVEGGETDESVESNESNESNEQRS